MPASIPLDRVRALLAKASRLRVLAVGDAMLDVYLTGDVERISPEAPVPVVRVRERREAMGGAANVAQNVVAAGAACSLVAALGRDSAGLALRSGLRHIGVADASLIEVERRTTRKTRIVARSQQLVRFDEEVDAALHQEEEERLLEAIRSAVATADAVILEDYNKGVVTPAVIREVLALARGRGIPVIVDPKLANFFAFSGATVFKPNRRELEGALGQPVDVDDPRALLAVLARLGSSHLLLTLGEAGMVLCSETGDVERFPAAARQVYDVVGAGDTVSAYLAVILAAGGTMVEAAFIANLAAGIEVSKLGAATVPAAELLELVTELYNDS